MYQYRSKRPSRRRKGVAQVILPFIIIVLLIGIIWAAWSLISRVRDSGNRSASDPGIQVIIDSGGAKGMTANQDKWLDFIGTDDLYAGEKLKVNPNGRLTLFYSPEMELRMDRSAEVEIIEFQKNEEQYTALTQLEEGLVWASLGNLAPSNSTFQLSTNLLDITASSANFAVEAPGTVYMVEGKGTVDIKNENGDMLRSVELGVGQQLLVDSSVLEDLEAGEEVELMFAMDDDFKRDNFYLWNAEQEGLISGDENTDGNETSEGENGDQEDGEEESVNSEDEASEEENSEKENDQENEEGEVVSGEVRITAPSEKAEHEVDFRTFTLEAKVPSNTANVKVGSYTLSQYKAGDSIARYYVSDANNNVSEGANTYTVTALDDNGNEIGRDSITVNVTAPEPDEESDDTDDEDNTPSGSVTITSPSSNASYETSNTTFNVVSSVPSGTSYVEVNGYRLSQYSSGSGSATYYVNPVNNNVSNGSNTYTVRAFDVDGSEIASDSITVTVTGEDSNAGDTNETTDNSDSSEDTPSELSLNFSYPSSGGTYTTDLSPINVGGLVSADVRNLYVNDEPLGTHALGKTEWSKSINLQPGLNTIKVYGEDELNNSTGVRTLTIDYQGQ